MIMIPNRMFPGEVLISAPENDKLVLTTHRLRSLKMGFFRKDFESIFLEDIASIAVKVRVNWVLFAALTMLGALVGFAFIFGGFQHRQDDMIWMGLFVMGVSGAFAYLIALKYVVCVSSKGGDVILQPAKSSDVVQIFTFVEAVEYAKAERVKSLSLRP
jgi:hypothetical protein